MDANRDPGNPERLALNMIAHQIVELEQLYMMMANVAAIIVDDMEDGDGDGNRIVLWEKVEVNTNDFLQMDTAFILHFRMNRDTFEVIQTAVLDHLKEAGRFLRERTPFRLIMMMVLWIMATPDSFRSVALQFGTSPSTVHYHYMYIIEALREMAPKYIKWPTAAERQETKEFFERITGFPGVVGCIDGTHHTITAPRFESARYVNRHHSYSLNSQFVCDHNLLIRDVYIGEVGSLHDSRIFRRSPLCRNLLENPALLNFDEHLLGDGAYILLGSVMTPIRNNGQLVGAERNYNRLHSQTRSAIENCFALKKGKWRRSKMLHVALPDIAVDHLMATAVLHNMCILEGESLEDLEEEVPAENGEEGEIEDADDLNGEVDGEFPNLPQEADHPNLEGARLVGLEKRNHLINSLPRVYA